MQDPKDASSTLPLGLAGLMVAGLAVRLGWSLLIPSWQGADEIAHYQFIAWVANHGSLPVMPPDAWSVHRYEDYQAPLYYVLMAPFWLLGDRLWGGPGEILALLRVSTAVLGLPLILVCHATARVLVPDRPGVPLAAAGVAAFLPMLAYNTATVNNDAPVYLACGVALLVMVRALVQQRLGTREALVLFLALLLGQYSKASALLMLPTTLCFAFAWGVQTRDWRGSGRIAGVLAACVLFTAPLWLRNLSLYGDALGVATVNADFPASGGVGSLLVSSRTILLTWWANFGRLNELNAPWSAESLYLGRLNLLFFLITGLGVLGNLGRWRPGRPGLLGAWMVAGACSMLFLAADESYGVRYGLSHGRYLFPAVAVLAAGLARGLGRLSGPAVAWWLPGFLLASTLYIWLRLIVPYYWGPESHQWRDSGLRPLAPGLARSLQGDPGRFGGARGEVAPSRLA